MNKTTLLATIICCFLLAIGLVNGEFINETYQKDKNAGSSRLLGQWRGQYPCPWWVYPSNVFFVDYDSDEMSQEEEEKFKKQFYSCYYQLYTKSHLVHYIQLWNSFNETFSDRHETLQTVDNYSVEQQRILLILLRLYLYIGTYIRKNKPLNTFRKRCIDLIYQGSDVLFSKIGHEIKQKDLIVPSGDIDYLKTSHKNLPMLRRMINDVAIHKNWLSVCEEYQCAIIACDR